MGVKRGIFVEDPGVLWSESLDSVGDAIFIIDKEQNILCANRAFENLVGVSQTKLVGRKCYEVVHGKDAPISLCTCAKTIEAQRTASTEAEEPNLGQGVFLFTTSPVFDDKGAVKWVIHTIRDITDRKRVERELHRRDAVLEAVAFAAERFLMAINWEDEIQEVLKRFGQATEVSRIYIFENHKDSDNTLLTSQRYEWVAPGTTPQIDNPELQGFPLVACGFGRWVEVMSKRQLVYGHVKDFPDSEKEVLGPQDIQSIVCVPIFVEKEWWGFIGFDECTHEREWSVAELDALKAAADTIGATIHHKRAEEEFKKKVRELEFIRDINIALNTNVAVDEVIHRITEGLTSVLGYDASAVYFIDPDKEHVTLRAYSSDSKIVRMIERLTGIKVTGYRAPILKGSIISRIIETQKPVLADDIAGVVRENTDNEMLKRIAPQIAKFSGLRSGVGAPLISSERVIGIIGVGSKRSISEEDAQRLTLFGNWTAMAIEKAESVKRLEKAYKELDQSNKLKDIFTDIMSHDLLNPAGAVRGMAELALEGEEDPDKKEVLQMILRSDEKIIGMIENASILAKLESGEKLKFEDGDLGDILRSAANEVVQLADKKNVKIKITAKKEFPVSVNPLIHDVFSNLLSNAIKYGPEDSEVVIKISADGPNWRISVADKGEGIPDRDKEEIFERFKRIEKGAVKGTGLGLAIVDRVVAIHKGRVWVEDNPGGGSVFIVLIPRAKQTSSA